MNDKQLLMIILAFFAGYMFDKIMNKMCSSSLTNNRLIEGFGEENIISLQKNYSEIWKIDHDGSSTDYMTKNNTKADLTFTQKNVVNFGPNNIGIRYMPQPEDEPDTILKIATNYHKNHGWEEILTFKVDDVEFKQDGVAVETFNLSYTYFPKDGTIFVSFSFPNNLYQGKKDWTGTGECWEREKGELPDLKDLSYKNCCKPNGKPDGIGNLECWKEQPRSYKYCGCDPPPAHQTASFLVDALLFHDPK